MDRQQFQFLLTEQGQQLLKETGAEPINAQNHLQLASRLRSQIDPHLAQVVIEQALLRQRAVKKFSRADQMFFTRAALEQASGEIVAQYRAERYFAAGCRQIAELGCGIGGDTIALAEETQVIGIDRDPQRLWMARENVRVHGLDDRFQAVEADLNAFSPLAVDGLFFDPARRDEHGHRFKSVHLYQPPLGLIDTWRIKTANIGVKISPGVDYQELPAGCEIEFISHLGQVKECVLWFGGLSRGIVRRATLLPSGISLNSADFPGRRVAISEPGGFIYEPDGAVIRAHLVRHLARSLGAAQIDKDIAYLTADTCQKTRFARCFRLDDWFPFQLKRLRHYLRERNIGQVTIKKRGSPIEPDYLQGRLRLQGSEQRILFLTHVQGKPAVLIGREMESSDD